MSTKKVLNLDNHLYFLYKRKSKLFLYFVQQVILGTVLFFEPHQNCSFLFTANGKTKGHHLTFRFYGRSIKYGLGGKRGLEGKANIIIVFKIWLLEVNWAYYNYFNLLFTTYITITSFIFWPKIVWCYKTMTLMVSQIKCMSSNRQVKYSVFLSTHMTFFIISKIILFIPV